MNFRALIIIVGLSLSLTGKSQYSFNGKRTFGETNHQIFSASYSSDGNYIVTTGSDNNVIIWNAQSGIIYKTLAGLKKRPNIALYKEKEQLLVSAGEDNLITIWNPQLLKITSAWEGHSGPVKALDISPDCNLLASGSEDRTIRLWDIKKGVTVFELKGHKGKVNSVRFSPDGKILASGGDDKKIILWNVNTGAIILSKEIHSDIVRDIVFSPDGNLIASCGDDRLIKVSKTDDLSLVNTLTGHKAWVQSIDFSDDGKYLISGGHDQLIILWESASGKLLFKSEKQGQIVLSVDICPVRPDFISATLLSEKLETWALSGIGESSSNKILAESVQSRPVFTEKAFDQKAEKENVNKSVIVSDIIDKRSEQEILKEAFGEKDITLPKTESAAPVIEVFAPRPLEGRVTYDKNNMYLIGRVSDLEGINTFLVNKNLAKLSEAGVFEIRLSLNKGENPVEIMAINNKGLTKQLRLIIDCTAEPIAGQNNDLPEIYRGKYYALIIGINEYQSYEIGDLENPVKDAESLYNVLTSKYTFAKENITFLKNPTLSEIIITMDELGKKFTENDNLLIFYAGHGYWDEKGKVGYWFPSDATRSSTVNWFRNSTLRDFIGSFVTRHTLLITDACFSGAIFKTRDAMVEAPKGIENLYGLPSRKAMTSGESVVPDESVFLKFLVKRLEENQETFLTSEFLFSSFKDAVMNNSPTVLRYGVIQNVGDEGGDFIFIKK